jgi:hypothetical protein
VSSLPFRALPVKGESLLARDGVELIAAALASLFDASEIKFKPAVVSGTRALALAYVDVRAIQNRLDEACGVAGWQDSYRVLPDGAVVCRLRLKIGEQWITKVDVGSPSGQPDNGDRTKAAFSDALKRAAVKFGIGRYLSRLPRQWCDYDSEKREFVQVPALPAWAVPTPPCIGADGACRLQELATRKGVPLAEYLGKIVGNSDTPTENLTREQARAVWKLVEALPEARPCEPPPRPQPVPTPEPARSAPHRRRRRLPGRPADACDARLPHEATQPVDAAQRPLETDTTN